jgi:hypothetical protein
MLRLNNRDSLWVGLALGLVMAATRGQHAAVLGHPLPDASLAVFFLAGVYLRPAWVFAALFLEGMLIDIAAVTWGGVSGFCISPAYGFLLPAYGITWAAGRWYSTRHRLAWSTLLPLFAALGVAVTSAELLASGGFYVFSGRFADLSLAEFGLRLIQYFPTSLQALTLYVLLAAVVHVAFSRSGSGKDRLAAG